MSLKCYSEWQLGAIQIDLTTLTLRITGDSTKQLRLRNFDLRGLRQNNTIFYFSGLRKESQYGKCLSCSNLQQNNRSRETSKYAVDSFPAIMANGGKKALARSPNITQIEGVPPERAVNYNFKVWRQLRMHTNAYNAYKMRTKRYTELTTQYYN